MKIHEDEIKRLFEEIMRRCKVERKTKAKNTLRGLASELGATENYLSAVENGREFPSMRLFLSYLLINGFDVSSLKSLEIRSLPSKATKEMKQKLSLVQKIYSLDADQIEFLAQQASVADQYGMKKRTKKRSK